MDRLLDILLRAFIRRGTLRVITASGRTFTFGDGTGKPVTLRFKCRAAQLALLLDPELKFGELYMDGSWWLRTARSRTRSRSCRVNLPKRRTGAARSGWPVSFAGACSNSIPGTALATTLRITTTSTTGSIRCSLTLTANTAAPILRRRISRSTTRSWPRSVTSLPSYW